MGQFHHHCPPVCPQTLFVWCGARSNVLERSRAQELAAAIRDSERGGKARLEIVADGEEPPEMVQVCPHWAERGTWVSLGWLRDPPPLIPWQVLGPKPPLQEGNPEEDVVADQSNTGAAVLYKARTRWDAMMVPGLGMPKCHHGGHRGGDGQGSHSDSRVGMAREQCWATWGDTMVAPGNTWGWAQPGDPMVARGGT